MQRNLDLVLLSVVSPILYGVYADLKLQEEFRSEKKTLDALVELCALIEEKKIKRIFYANGPGSFTAIKLTHIFLQTLQSVKGIELFATHAFSFNQNGPIRAFGNQYFFYENEQITLKDLGADPCSVFALPDVLETSLFHHCCEPFYVLPAV